MIEHAGKLYALWEGGSAWELDPRDARARAARRRGATTSRTLPFSAHPQPDTDGSLWNFGALPYLDAPKLVLWRVASDGALASFDLIEAPNRGYIHSFAITARHLVLVVAPLFTGVSDGKAFFEGQAWKPETG